MCCNRDNRDSVKKHICSVLRFAQTWHNAAKTTDSVQNIKQLHSPSKHKMSRGILLLCPSREPALIFLWKEKIRVIRGSLCVSHQGVEGLRLDFSPPTFKQSCKLPLIILCSPVFTHALQITPYPVLSPSFSHSAPLSL